MSARVAVIMRTKNRPLLLERAVRSVLAQSFTDVELVVVAEGGADAAAVERRLRDVPGIDRLSRERLLVLASPTPADRAGALDAALAATTAEFFAVVDEDGSWSPDFLERAVAHLSRAERDGAVHGGTHLVLERVGAGRIEEVRRTIVSAGNEVSLESLGSGDRVLPVGLVFRRSAFEAAVEAAERVVDLDWSFLIRFVQSSRIGGLAAGEEGGAEADATWHQPIVAADRPAAGAEATADATGTDAAAGPDAAGPNGADEADADEPEPRTALAPASPASASGAGLKRVVFYLFFDPEGRVDDYVLYKLGKLREHVEHIFVVSNGPITEEGRARLDTVADTVWQRENVGFDVWGYKEAQERFGWDRLAEYDELILMNYTFFGPIFPFAELFDRMDASDVDFWGITEHEAVTPHPHHGHGTMPAHIQSHWIAVRGDMLRSSAYREYWTGMPMITSYDDSIDRHEARFTQHFADLGFRYEVAFPASDYPSQHPIFDNIVLMLEDRLPILKRRIFFHDPLYLDREVIIGRDALDLVAEAGYPMELIWRNVVRSAKPRVLNTNFTMMEILPDADQGLDRRRLPAIVAVVHLYYEDLADEILDHLDTLPGRVDVVVTTTDERKREAILATARARGYGDRIDVRIVESNRGRDISAFVVACADVLRDERYDLVVKIHGKKSVQDGWNAGQWFKRHLLENLLDSSGYSANLIKLFQDDPSLGMVFPPVIHMGYPTMGHAWFLNKEPAQELAARLGIRVPFDDTTPLSPFGSMFVARREALRPIVEAGFTWDDFPAEDGYEDGTLAHVLERLFSYAVLGERYTVRTVMNARLAAISHTFLEYKLQAVSAFLPGFAIEQVPYLVKNQLAMSPVQAVKRYVARRSPRTAVALGRIYRSLRRRPS